jgi:hypothetical protein
MVTAGKSSTAAIVIGKEPLDGLPFSKIHSIVITANKSEMKDTLILNRAKDGWVVVSSQGYPADAERIEKFVREFKDMKVLRELSAPSDQLGRIELIDPGAASENSATRVTLQDKEGKALHTLHLGKELSAPGSDNQNSPMGGGGGFPDRRFVMIDSDRSKITVVDQTFSNASTTPSDWLNKDFIQVEKPNSIEVIYPGEGSTNSWKITKSSDVSEWELEGKTPEGKILDTASAPSSPLSSPSFNDLATDIEKLQLDENATLIKIKTFDALNYEVKVGPVPSGSDRIIQVSVSANLPKVRTPVKDEKPEDKKQLDEEWAAKQKTLTEKLEKESGFTKHAYRVSSYTVDSILKKREELLKAKEEGAIKPPTPGELPIPFQPPPPIPNK